MFGSIHTTRILFFNYLRRFLYYQNLRYIENEFKVCKQTWGENILLIEDNFYVHNNAVA